MNAVSRTVLSLVLLGLGIGGFFWLGEPEIPTRQPDAKEPPVVQTTIATDHKDGIQFEVDGVVVPYRQIEIAAQVSGRVEFRADQCRKGRAVKKGDLLLRIEQSDYDLEVKRLTEELTQADAMLSELDAEIDTVDNQIASARKQLEIDVRQLERNTDLLARSAASESEVDTARRAELTARNAMQTLLDQKSLIFRRRVRLESAKVLGQANLDKAQLALARTEIVSPLDGVVVSESVEQDGYVQLGSTVISLQDSSQLDVTCKLHMRQMHWLWQGPSDSESTGTLSEAYDFPDTPAKVIYDLGGVSYQWDGVVNRYDGAGVDNQTRMIPCRVYVANPLAVTSTDTDGTNAYRSNPPTLMTGMFVKVRIDARPPIPLVQLPQGAIQPGNTVWTVDDGQLKRKHVLIANSDSEFVVAYQQQDGLQAGDAVVVSPLATPIEGLAVIEMGKEEFGKKTPPTDAKSTAMRGRGIKP
jgi:multidrug efflux pump subunit AcrA (membrane-fusion protein)